MRSARPAFIAPSLIGLLLASSGCYRPYQSPYGGYGNPYGNPYGGQSMPGAPVQTLQPGGTYAPSYGQPVYPQGTSATPSTIDQTGGDAPFYGSGGGSSQQPYDGGGGVPTYSDPNEVQFNNDFQQPVQPGPGDNTAVEQFGAIDGVSASMSEVAKVDLDTADFVAPAISQQHEPQPTFASVPTAPYAYDADYEWLRGILRFDASTGTWVMIYSESPATDDQHGGRLVVAQSPELESYKPQAVVLLRGQVDADASAAAGRAVYRVTAIEPVELSTP